MARAFVRGSLVGAGAGLLTSLADFGAHWLWLSGAGDQLWFLRVVLGLQLPIGALLGGLVALAIAASSAPLERWLGRRLGTLLAVPAARALQLSVLAAPGLIAIGHLLFTGGKMSRLPGGGALQPAAALLMIAAFGLATAAVVSLEQRLRTARARQAFALAAVLAGFGLSKLDQLVMPGLYAYLHAALATAAFACHAAALSWLLPEPAPHIGRARGVGVLSFALAILTSTVFALDDNQNVRVALQHPNASTTRSIMLGLGPLVLEPMQRRAFAEARQRLRQRRAADTRETSRPVVVDGPRFEDAHVLLITVDALRPDHLGSYGYARKTSPSLDALAAQAVTFERAYAPAPHSSYSLCSMMTSEYLHETLDLGHPAPRETLATALAAVGYHTAAFFTLGVFHTAGEKLRDYEKNALGFSLHDHVAYEAEALTDRVLSEIDRTLSRGEPSTLLWAHYFDVHEPYEDTRFGTSDMDRYDGEINKADTAIDRLIREARKRFTRELIIVVTADHGEEFREHGGVYHGSTLYEEQIRVPLIIQVPGLAARRIAAPVETLALAPTILGLVGVAVPRTMRGADLRPVLAGKEQALGPAFAAVIHKKMVVRWPHKLIADLRFGLFELYDLAKDPHERENLAGAEPALRDALRDEVYGWLDTLTPPAPGSPADAATAADPRLAALDLGRLGDRRAVQPLIALASDQQAPLPERLQAAKMLGHLADATSSNALALLLEDPSAPLAAEAAIALGRMFDQRAKATLRRVVASEDPDVRTRAAVSLGRLRDRAAVPALIEALWLAPREYEREEAVRWLGRLGDPQALDPLLQILPESRTRHLAVIAIGRLRDPRTFDALASVLASERLSDVRSATVQGFGYLGDPRAIDLLAPLAAADASLSTATESLVRLGAIRRGAIGGADITREAGLRGFGACEAGDPWHDWDYLRRTYCTTNAAQASLRIELPQSVVEKPSVVVISARRSDKPTPTGARIAIGKLQLQPVTIDGSWSETRIELSANELPPGRQTLAIEVLSSDAKIDLDHVLVLPKSP